jgi:hypothetical protein
MLSNNSRGLRSSGFWGATPYSRVCSPQSQSPLYNQRGYTMSAISTSASQVPNSTCLLKT